MKKTAVMMVTMVMVLVSISHAPASAADYEFRVISHNVAGGPKNFGGESAFQTVYEQVPLFHPNVVMLQEVCMNQRDMFERKYRANNWSVHWTPMRANHPNCPEIAPGVRHAQGQLLASKHSMTEVTSTPLPGTDPTLRQFSLLCATVHAGLVVRACTTHLIANGTEDVRALQTQTIAATVAPYIAADMPVVVGGDFNAEPDAKSMDHMYRLDTNDRFTGTGQFHEGDQTDPTVCAGTCRGGEVTIGQKKLDYVFFSENACDRTVSGYISGGVITSTVSDHDLYRAWCKLQG